MNGYGFGLVAMALLPSVLFAATRVDAEWQLKRNWSSHEPTQQWVETSAWHDELTLELALQEQGFGASALLTDGTLQLQDLYVEFASNRADWTLGRKPQEWGFAHGDSALNRIDERSFIMREQYLPFGQWQLLCLQHEQQAECLSRLSGWYDAWDWQLLAGYQHNAYAGFGIQRQVGLGGLVYGEWYYQHLQPITQLQQLTTDIHQLSTTEQTYSEAHLGMQWSSDIGFTIHWQASWRSAGLSRQDWQWVSQQLDTPQAGLIAGAFSLPMLQQQLLRLQQNWQQWQLEQVLILWPEAQASWLSQSNISYLLNDKLTLAVQWEHHGEASVFRDIGVQDDVAMRFQYVNSF